MLIASLGLVIFGMRLADVLPLPTLPRPPLGRTMDASAGLGASIVQGPRAPDRDLYPSLPPAGSVFQAVTMQDVAFKPIQVPLWPAGPRLQVTADKEEITLTDSLTGRSVWKGPNHDARFVYANISAARSLKDSKGRLIWADSPVPDLRFDRRGDGTARLTDKKGQILWSGDLAPTVPAAIPRSERRETTYTVDFAGVQIRGINGYFTLAEDHGGTPRVLWSGTLPARPEILLRTANHFLFVGADGEQGVQRDHIVTIRFAGEAGHVTMTDARLQVIGTRPFRLLRADNVAHSIGPAQGQTVLKRYYVPFGNLAKSGTVLFTYQDESGRIIYRNSVVREGDRQRINNNGVPF
jgi:hypothetical protein